MLIAEFGADDCLVWSERYDACLRGGKLYKDSNHQKQDATEEEKIERFVKRLPNVSAEVL